MDSEPCAQEIVADELFGVETVSSGWGIAQTEHRKYTRAMDRKHIGYSQSQKNSAMYSDKRQRKSNVCVRRICV